MAKIYYINKFVHKNDRYSVIDIYNWRYLKDTVIIQDNNNNIPGVIIHLDYAVFIPYLDIDNIHYLNRVHTKEEKVERFYIEHGIDTPLCTKCWGKGKLDWIEKARNERNLYPMFSRDSSSALVYPGFDTIIFARSLLNIGEEYCSSCMGTGLLLDERHKEFQGMSNMKKHLKPIKFEKEPFWKSYESDIK